MVAEETVRKIIWKLPQKLGAKVRAGGKDLLFLNKASALFSLFLNFVS